MLLKDRVAIVTGAGRGIGYGIAETFAREGAVVVIGELVEDRGHEAAEKLKAQGYRAQAIGLDVTQPDSCRLLCEQVLAEYGRIDTLINTAGLFILHKSEDMPEADWRIQIDVMLNGVFFMTQAVARAAMIPQRRGSVVNIASIGGMGGWPMRSAYNAAKAGVIVLTEALATEWAQYNIRLNCVSPGVTRTEMMDVAIKQGVANVAKYLNRIAEANETTGRTAAESLRAEGGSAQFEPLDVRDPQQSAALVDKLAGQRGHIDVWVNNAGISRLAPAETMPLSDWDDSIAVMLSGTFYCSQAVGRHMLARGKGVIVNIASVTGMVHHHDRAAYSVAKAGVIALTEALGVEWAGRGVRVVGVAPAVVLTEMVRATVEAGQGALDVFERRTPMRRLGTPEEIAEAVFFLAGDEASYITAETMRVDGGWVAYQLF